MAVRLRGRPYMDCSAGLAKLWMALRAQVLQKKNEKHSHTEGSFEEGHGMLVAWQPATGGALAWWAHSPGGRPARRG